MKATDQFALLGVPRQPWLDGEMLKERFHELSKECHPDRAESLTNEAKAAATQRYAALNAAYTRLREPKDRLAHLLELETGARPRVVQDVPPALMDLCLDVGGVCQRVDRFLAEQTPGDSPMLRAARFAGSMEHQEALNTMLERLRARTEGLCAELRALNEHWETLEGADAAARAGQLPLARVEEIWRLLSYLNRWTGQLQERLVRLAMWTAP